MASSKMSPIDISVFNDQKSPTNDYNDFESCVGIKRILTLLRYYSLLQVNSNRDHQTIFTNFINTIYDISVLIMDQYHLQKKHNHEINEIMNYAVTKHEFPSCDISTCAYSSRLYRVPDKSAQINIFDKEDKESSLSVYIDIIGPRCC